VFFIGCTLIDDDLSVCGTDYIINYEMRLVTDMQMTINEELSLDIEQKMADTLRHWLAPTTSGHAHDLDVSFYSLDGTDELKHHWNEVIDATQKSYTLYIPREDYMHLAVVNIAENDNVSLSGAQHSATMRLNQKEMDTLPSHPTAIFTAREKMEMLSMNDSILQFDVHLYMVSSAVALVVDSIEVPVTSMKVLLSGTATGFEVKDSVFTYAHPSLIRMERLTDQCYAAVAWPSRDEQTAAAPCLAGAPRKTAQEDEPAYWELRAYVNLPDGTTTETVLSVHKPLLAGTLEIICVNMKGDGSLQPIGKPEVGASVQLDWKDGSTHEIEI